MSSGRQRPGEISVGFSRRKVRGQSPKLWDKACKRRKGWPKYHALHVSPEWCKVFPKFVAAEQSWEILLLYKHRHFIRGHQNKFCLCFALHNLKRHLPNKQIPFLFHCLQTCCFTWRQTLQQLPFCSNMVNVLSSLPPPLRFSTWGIQLLAEKLEKRKME